MSTSSVIRRFVAPLTCAMLLTACQTVGPVGLVPSTVSTELTPDAANTIAGDMVGQLSDQTGPGNTTISLTPGSSTFGQALETELLSRGYAVVTDQKTDDTSIIALAYVVDDFDGSVLVRISTLSFDLTRIYKIGAEGATPVSPLSIRQHGSGSAE
jgi:uncharacterized lipoprotein YajG